jgi:hypothetical protein
MERGAQVLEAATDHRHLVEPDRREDDPHDRKQAEDRTLGGGERGQAEWHAVGDDGHEDRDAEGGQAGPVRLPSQHAEQDEDREQW